ncbi:MAG TPA: AtpZ/AtpI family protein [Gemmatimonadales bacterium]|nr:AtpZ/AtpI family protein [Gemmatimonadales bacterium]
MPSPSDDRNRFARSFGTGYSYVAVGFQLVATILVFGGVGWLVDGWLHTRPLFAIAGFVVGAVGWFISLYYRVQRDTEAERTGERGKGKGEG